MKYIIEEERLKELLKKEKLLDLLEINGVDNWYSYSECADMIGVELPTEESLKEDLKSFTIIL